MAWRFRLYGKKRGERRTGSSQLGRTGLGVFSAGFLLAGLVFLAVILWQLSIPEWRVNHQFVETKCQVLDTRIGMNADGLTRPEVHIEYEVDGRPFDAWTYDITAAYQSDDAVARDALARFQPGNEYPCWYDPINPQTAVLARGYTWFAWLVLLLPAALISVGAGGLAYVLLTWGKSTERLAATGQRPAGLDLFKARGDATPKYPFVPDPEELNDSPGTNLAYRLPAGTGEWNLLAALLFAVLWNGVVAVFLTMAVHGFRRGQPDWFLTIFVVPFALAGIGAIAFVIRQLMIATGVGPTIIEISSHPLFPGEEYDILMSQGGQLAIQSLELRLVCEEVATYRQGTNTRTAARRVYEQVLLSREGFDIQQGLPFEARARLAIPATAMHSFKAGHNRVDWKIVVKGAVARWPDFERGFPIIVCPAPANGEPTR
ncbi:MAG: DUF3592 domain-containing protein [Planctomycetia bacterium]|nr:DUF3592 domain-containing protein [Planctomycetia bacterium]